MPVNSKTLIGRRTLNFNSLEEIVSDVEMLVAAPRTKTLGNWPLEQLISHLAMAFRGSLDGFPFQAPLFVRLIVPFFKARALKSKMSPGIKLPAGTDAVAYPDAASSAAALADLKSAIARTRTEKMEARHPAFGAMTHDEWYQFHLRHSELHLSFAVVE